MFCTITDIKARLGLASSTEYDDILTKIVAGVSAMFERYCKRPLLMNSTDVTEYYHGGCDFIQLQRYPVISITSIKEQYGDFDFDGADSLVTNEDYRLVNSGKTGVVKRINTIWPCGADAVQVIYRGGYCAADVAPATGTNEVALPADLQEAAILQTCLLFKRRDDIGLSSQSFQGGSLNVFSKLEFEPIVKQVLDNGYRRITL